LLDYALEAAGWIGDSQMVSALLQNGADIQNPRPGRGFDLIAQAAQHGMRDLVERLLDNGGDPNAVSRDGRGISVIEFAALNGHANIVELAIQRGGTLISRSTHHQLTVFHSAALCNRVDYLQALWDGVKAAKGKQEAFTLLNMKTKEMGETPLHFAVGHGNVKALKWLLNHNARVTNDHSGLTPFHVAVRSGNLDIIHLFLNSDYLDKRDVIRSDSNCGVMILHWAARIGDEELCVDLLRHDPQCILQVQKRAKNTALHIAAMKGNEKVARILASAAEKRDHWLDLANIWQKTHLIEAASNDCPSIVTLLLQHGADPTIRVEGKFLGEEFDRYNPFTGCYFTVLHSVIAFEEFPAFKVLLDYCADHMEREAFPKWLSIPDFFDRSALDIATDIGADDFAQELLQRGAQHLLPFCEKRYSAVRERIPQKPLMTLSRNGWKELNPAARPTLPFKSGEQGRFLYSCKYQECKDQVGTLWRSMEELELHWQKWHNSEPQWKSYISHDVRTLPKMSAAKPSQWP
jgi:ankyrin repeat protein